jgi:hypothetical protein
MRGTLTALVLSFSASGASADDPSAKELLFRPSTYVYKPRCSEADCQRIQRGMTLEQVKAIVGCPPGDYTAGRGMYVSFIDPFPANSFSWHYKIYWCGDDGGVGVKLDRNGLVATADWYPSLFGK